MALGRVSPFSKLSRSSVAGQNLTASATEAPFTGPPQAAAPASPFAALMAPDPSLGSPAGDPGGGGAPGEGAPGVGEAGGNTSGITGPNSNLASMGLSFATMGLPGLGSITGPLGASVAGPIGGLVGGKLGGMAQGAATNAALGMIGSDLSSPVGPISFSPAVGPGGIGRSGGLTGIAASILGSLGVPGFTAPTFAATTPFGMANIDPKDLVSTPNVGLYSGPNLGMPAPSTFSGFAGSSTPNTGEAANFSFSGRQAGVAPTGEPNSFSTNFGMRGNAGVGEGESGGTVGNGTAGQGGGIGTSTGVSAGDVATGIVGDSTAVSGPAPGGTPGGPVGQGDSGIGPGTGTAPTGDAGQPGGPGGGPGAGDGNGDGGAPGGSAGAPSGGGDSGNAGDFHEGGFVELGQDGMGGNTKNSPDEGQKGVDEVDAKLLEGEFVVNREAAGRFGKLLNNLNEIGRSQQLKDALNSILEEGVRSGFKALTR